MKDLIIGSNIEDILVFVLQEIEVNYKEITNKSLLYHRNITNGYIAIKQCLLMGITNDII